MNESQRMEQSIADFFTKSDKEQQEKLRQENQALAKKWREDQAHAERERREEEKRERERAKAEKQQREKEERQRREKEEQGEERTRAEKEARRERGRAEVGERIGAGISSFAGGAERGKEFVEEKLMGGVGTGVKTVSTGEKVVGKMLNVAGGIAGGLLFPEKKAGQKLSYGDRIAYPLGTVLKDDKYVLAWRVIKMPYESIDHTEMVTEQLTSDIKEVGSLGEAYKAVEQITGKPPVDLFIHLKELDEGESTVETPSGLPQAPVARLPRITKVRQVQPVEVGLKGVSF